jgi:hypothetical protein
VLNSKLILKESQHLQIQHTKPGLRHPIYREYKHEGSF